jgi:AbrB family looped-hinge helix DNA binding protein
LNIDAETSGVLAVSVRIEETKMRVTSKGQVTIPQAVRERLGIVPGGEVEFVVEGGVARLIPVKNACRRGRKIVKHLTGRGTVKMTTDEIMKLTRRA